MNKKLTRLITAAVTIAAMVCMGTAQAGARPEMGVRFYGLLPGEDLDWDSAFGADLQARFLDEHGFGFALVAGVQEWAARSEYREEEADGGILSTAIDREVTVVPFGASLMKRVRMGEFVSLLMEFGLRYAFVDSDIRADIMYEDALGTDYEADIVEVDNAFLAVGGIMVEGEIDEGINLAAGLSYQADLTEPEERFLGESIGKTGLDALALQVGVSWEF